MTSCKKLPVLLAPPTNMSERCESTEYLFKMNSKANKQTTTKTSKAVLVNTHSWGSSLLKLILNWQSTSTVNSTTYLLILINMLHIPSNNLAQAQIHSLCVPGKSPCFNTTTWQLPCTLHCCLVLRSDSRLGKGKGGLHASLNPQPSLLGPLTYKNHTAERAFQLPASAKPETLDSVFYFLVAHRHPYLT